MSGTRSAKGKERQEDNSLPSIKDIATLESHQLPELRDFSALMTHPSGRRGTPADAVLLSTRLYGYEVQPDLQLPSLPPNVPVQGPPRQAAYEQLPQQSPSNPAAHSAIQAPASRSGLRPLLPRPLLPQPIIPQPPASDQAAQRPPLGYEEFLLEPRTQDDIWSGMELYIEPLSSSPNMVRFAHYHSTTGQVAGPAQSQSQQAGPASNSRLKTSTARKTGYWTCCLCTASNNQAPEIASAKWRCPVVHRESNKVNERGYHLRCEDCKSVLKELPSLQVDQFDPTRPGPYYHKNLPS